MNETAIQLTAIALTAAGLIVTIIIFYLQVKMQTETERASNYQTLEFAANEALRFEAEHHEFIDPFMTREKSAAAENLTDAYASSYVYQVLTLFEIATRFYKRGYIDEEVFISWIVWFFSMLNSWYFRENWMEIRINYTDDIREIFDMPVRRYSLHGGTDDARGQFFLHVSKVLKRPQIHEEYKGNLQEADNGA